jgi:hypothetical protein
MAGKKGSSPKISQYFKIDGDKLTRIKKNCSRCGKGVEFTCPNIKTDILVENAD